MNQSKEYYIKRSKYFADVSLKIKDITENHLNKAREDLGFAYIARNVFREERRCTVKLVGIMGMMTMSLVLFQKSILTFLIFGASFVLAKKSIRHVNSREQFTKIYPDKSEWLHKSNREIKQSILSLEDKIRKDEETMQNLKDKLILYRCFLLCSSSDDMVNKVEKSIEQLKEYRELLIQFEKETAAVNSPILYPNEIPSITYPDEKTKTKSNNV